MSKPKSPFDKPAGMPDRTKETIFPTGSNLNESLESIPTSRIPFVRTPIETESRGEVAVREQTILVPAGSEVIIFNKQFSPSLLNELEELEIALTNVKPVSNQYEVIVVNDTLKKASRFVKRFDEARKAMGEELTKYKDSLLLEQKNLLGTITTLIETTNNQIVLFQKQEAQRQAEEQKRIQLEKEKELKAIQAENERKQRILGLINQYETNGLTAIAGATIDTIDSLISTFNNIWPNESTYMEFLPQALQMRSDLAGKFVNRKKELVEIAELEKSNKEAADKLKADQEAQALRDKKAAEERISEQKALANEQAESDIANAQMISEFKSSSQPKLNNVMKRWVYEPLNIASLPLEYHTFDDPKIKEALKAGARDIPGIRIYEEISNVKR